MCWGTNKKPKRLRADYDIPVFKIARIKDGVIKPYFFQFEPITYAENKTYEAKISPILRDSENFSPKYRIGSGLHSYSTKHIRLKQTYKSWIETTIHKIPTTASRPIRTTSQDYQTKRCAILLCIIPKGSDYYFNEEGEFVSEKLTVKHIIEEPFQLNKSETVSARSISAVNKVITKFEETYEEG